MVLSFPFGITQKFHLSTRSCSAIGRSGFHAVAGSLSRGKFPYSLMTTVSPLTQRQLACSGFLVLQFWGSEQSLLLLGGAVT